MADEAGVVDAVSEGTGSDTASLDEWANTEPAAEEAQPEQAEAAEDEEAQDEPPKPKPVKKGADAVAEQGGKPKTAPRGPDGKFQGEADKKPAQQAKPQPYDPKAKIKLAIDGEEEETTLEEALRRARKYSAADKRFQEAAKLRQEAERLKTYEPVAQMWTPDDVAAARNEVKKAGGNPDDPQSVRLKLAEMDVLRAIEAEKMSPEARRAMELDRENQRLKAEQQQRENQAKEAEQQQVRKALREKYDKDFSQALTSKALPATPYTVGRVATVMQQNLAMGVELTAEEAAELVKEDLANEQSAYLKGLSAEQTVKLALPALSAMKPEDAVKVLPKGFLDSLRKYDLEQARAGNRKVTQPAPKALGSVPSRPRHVKTTSEREAADLLEKWANG